MKPTVFLITVSLLTLGLLATAPAQATPDDCTPELCEPEQCLEDPCEVSIEQHCIDGEHREKDVGRHVITVHLEYCQPDPLGDTTSQDAASCEDWSGDRTEDLPGPLAFSDDRCLAHLENKPQNCVGPWPGTIEGSAGPVGWTIHYCQPPGGLPPGS